MALDARPDVEQHERDLADAARRWAPELRAAADRLVAEGSARLGFDGTDVDARLVRFWRGDSLLEIRYRRPDSEGESRTRIPRQPPPELLADHLAQVAATG
jgi:hypothetical protein